MLLVLLKVPSFSLLCFIPFLFLPSLHLSWFCVSFYFSCSCFHLILFPLRCFLLSRFLFPSILFYSFRCASRFILYSYIYCSLCFLWLWYEPWVAKWREFLRESPSSLRYQVVSCSLGWRGETLWAFWFRYYIFFFYLCWKRNFCLIGITGSLVWEQ